MTPPLPRSRGRTAALGADVVLAAVLGAAVPATARTGTADPVVTPVVTPVATPVAMQVAAPAAGTSAPRVPVGLDAVKSRAATAIVVRQQARSDSG
jgi:hypothetical protein